MLRRSCSANARRAIGRAKRPPFSLLTYDDARRHGEQIAAVVRRRLMPPWLPEPGFGHFADERRLTDAQIVTVQQWVKQGMPQGDPADLPPAPQFVEGWQLGQPDLIVTAPRPFHLPADGPDVYRNLVLPVNLDGKRYVRTMELRPGNLQSRASCVRVCRSRFRRPLAGKVWRRAGLRRARSWRSGRSRWAVQ